MFKYVNQARLQHCRFSSVYFSIAHGFLTITRKYLPHASDEVIAANCNALGGCLDLQCKNMLLHQ